MRLWLRKKTDPAAVLRTWTWEMLVHAHRALDYEDACNEE